MAIVDLLLQAGANPNYVDGDEGATPLMCAIASQNPEMVHRLIQAGANVHAANHTGKTPLMKAAELGNRAIVELLVQSGAITTVRDNVGKNAALVC